MGLYDRDFHAWTNEQADAARRRSANEIDWDNLAEELESLGKQARAELRSRFGVLLLHLLKWRYQPGMRSRSWKHSVNAQRKQIERHLAENPSLKASQQAIFEEAYEVARLQAASETHLPLRDFPIEPSFTPEQAQDADFWPEAVR